LELELLRSVARRTLGIATLEERMAVVEASQARLQSADGQKLCRQHEPEVPYRKVQLQST
jgi:hypothetical protein